MKYAIWIFVVVGILYLLLKRPTSLKHRHLSDARINELVDALYRRGFDEGSLVVRATGHSFSVTKRIHGEGDVRLYGLATLPEVGETDARMQSRLAELGLHSSEEVNDGPPLERSLRIDFGDKLGSITDAIRIVATDGWGVDIEQEGFATLNRVSERNVSIGWEGSV
jgi:hypothetical protein